MCFPIVKFDTEDSFHIKYVSTMEKMVDPRINESHKFFKYEGEYQSYVSSEDILKAWKESFTLDFYKKAHKNGILKKFFLSSITDDALNAMISFLEEQENDFPFWALMFIKKIEVSSNSFSAVAGDCSWSNDWSIIRKPKSEWKQVFSTIVKWIERYTKSMSTLSNRIHRDNLPYSCSTPGQLVLNSVSGLPYYSVIGYQNLSNCNTYDNIQGVLQLAEQDNIDKIEVNNTFSINVYPKEVIVDRSQYYRLMNYTYDIVDAHPYKLSLKKDNSTLHYGVELEASTDCSYKDIVSAPSSFFLICKSDSSVTGNRENMIEMVTLPATLKAHKQHWAEIFNTLGYSSFDTSSRTDNGMHVHISKDNFFDDTHMKNFAWFIMNPHNHEFISEIGERGDNIRMNSYCKFFNNSWSKIRGLSNLTIYKKCMFLLRTLGKNARVNITKDKTLEVRLFKGFVSYATIIKNLEFLEAVYYFSINRSYSTNTLEHFFKYLDSTSSNQYATLKEFIIKSDLRKQVRLNITLTKVKKVKTPKAMSEALMKVKDKEVLNTLIDHLNAEFCNDFRFFINYDGNISYEVFNRSKLFELDEELAKRISRRDSSNPGKMERLI